mmetsp:Transcript_33889/g.93712  ORF Transcript_33889/g.93712 Transcript_33889/m.93712 type:complete len:762 (-) Transcript_33889:258-2543(-)
MDSVTVCVAVGSTCLSFLVVILGRRQTRFLGKDEQLRVQTLTDVEVHNGPGLKFLVPLTYRSFETVKAETLGNLDYVKLRDIATGAERIETGPKLLFLGPYDAVEKTGKGLTLSSTEYVLVEDKLTGGRSVKRGPCVWFPGPQEEGHKGSAIALSSTEYVSVVDKQTGDRRVEKGPQMWFPGPMEEGRKGSGTSLSSTEYMLVENRQTGESRVDVGPCIWFPGPQEDGKKGSGISLSSTEYINVENKQTGDKKMVNGPCIWFPQPNEIPSEVLEAVALQDDEYLRLKDMSTGQRWVQRGKALVFLQPTWKIELTGASSKGREAHGIRKAWVLKKFEFVRLLDTVTGKVTTHRGEATVFPEPDEQPLDEQGKMGAIDLKVNEYVKLLDQATGEIRVVSGREQVFLGPHERILDGGKQKAVEVDSEHAVLVRNKSSGQLRLVTENQLFVPGPDESIEEVRNLIRLAEHEAMIVKDREGRFQYHFGSPERRSPDQPPSFFLPPYAEVVKLCWSRGRRREKRDLYIERFDCRAQYMSFEFSCRTKDNVELILEGTFFWEVVDLRLMVQTTGDTSGDLCNHARSQFIKHVARVTLKEFMDDLNVISNKVYQEDQSFYDSRGVKVHSLEVTAYKCAEQSTSEVLQQIIQETTNRMNRLSQAESENEVKLFRMQGQIEQERLNGELIAIQLEHSQQEAQGAGASEAERVAAFIKGLAGEVPKLEDRVAVWQTLRKTEALSVVSQGGASLYFTPNDVNLSIETSRQACA